MLNPEGAAFYNEPDFLAVTKAAFREVNAAGGINGRPLKLDWCNESNDANKSAACLRSFVSHKDVATINSLALFNPSAGVSILGPAKIAGVNWNALTTLEQGEPNFFPFDGLSGFENAVVAGFAVRTLGYKKIAMFSNDTPAAEVSEKLITTAVEKGGGAVVANVKVPTTPIADWSPYAQQVVSSGAQAVSMALPDNQTLSLAKAIRALETSKITLIGIAGRSQAALQENASIWDGSYFGSPIPWVTDAAQFPVMQRFVKAMKAQQDSGDKTAALDQLRPIAIRGYVSVLAMVDVLKAMADKGTEINAANFLAAFKSASVDTGLGFKWTPGKPVSVPGLPQFKNYSNPYEFLLQFKDGKQTLYQKTPINTLDYLK